MLSTFRIRVKHTADDGYETHPEAVIEVQAEDRLHADALVEGLLVAGGDAADWEFGVTTEPGVQAAEPMLVAALRGLRLYVAQFEDDSDLDELKEAADHALEAAAGLEEAPSQLVTALREIIRRAPDQEPEYQDWGGDTEDAETWGQSAGLWEAAEIAREALRAAGLDIGAEEIREMNSDRVNAQADAEGWGLYEAGDGLELQRDDAAGIFEDDCAAWRHVAGKASEGSELHRRALEILEEVNPAELARIREATEVPRD
jgi:hypothetical protein